MRDAGETSTRVSDGIAAPRGASRPLRDRVLGWRNTLLASRRFQRWSMSFPLTRPIAKAQAQAAFDLCAGFVYTQVLFAIVELDVLEAVADEPQTAEEIAARHHLAAEPCTRLLDAAVALRVLSRGRDGRYGLGLLGAAMRANPGIHAMVKHNAMVYRDLADPLALLRQTHDGTSLGRYWAYAKADAPANLGREATERYTALMSASQSLIAEDIIEAYPFRRHTWLLDVGGGDGTLLSAMAEAHPSLRLSLFDLPSVVDVARERLASRAPRAETFAGSFFDDELPMGPDVVTLVRVLLDHDDKRALRILQAVHRAISPRGTVLIAETLSGVRGAERVSDAYFGMYLMAMGSGRPRSFERLAALLSAAGFGEAQLLSTRHPMLTSLVMAKAEGNKVYI